MSLFNLQILLFVILNGIGIAIVKMMSLDLCISLESFADRLAGLLTI